MKFNKPIILASTSPRRKELMKKTGLKFEVVAGDFEEYLDLSLDPKTLVERLSLGKARAVYEKHKNSIIIAADTLVYYESKVLGKPKNEAEAKIMLEFLSGKAHSLITGHTIISGEKIITKSRETKIWMKNLSAQEINDYIETKEPLDKAGAYSIQGKGSALIEKIEGDFDSAVGLPIQDIMTELKEITL